MPYIYTSTHKYSHSVLYYITDTGSTFCIHLQTPISFLSYPDVSVYIRTTEGGTVINLKFYLVL